MTKYWLLVTLLFFITPPEAAADRERAPEDYQIVSGNGEYVFVMLEQENFVEGQDAAIRKIYSRSGLYKNDGSSTPLWTIDWYSHKDEVYVSSDGKHVVRMGPWPRLGNERHPEPGGPSLKQLAVAFHENGKLLKEYTIDDLVDDTKKLSTSISHFEWKKDVELDEGLGRFTVTTLEGKRFVFDIGAGEIVERSQV